MGYPKPSGNDINTNNTNNLHYYQGILIVELSLTLILYLILRIIHYVKWGYNEELPDDDADKPKADQDDGQSRKWDMKTWNVYFPIIFSQHIGAIALIIVYYPYIFSAVIGFLHFLCFCVMIIINICIKDAEPGKGSRTTGSRIVWVLMCLFNIMLILGGLSEVQTVYSMP